MTRWLIACALALMCACAGKTGQPEPANELFVILPGNFIVDLAADSEVWLDPGVQEFALFPTKAEALSALKKAALPGEWRVYRMAGTVEEIAAPRGSGYALAHPARVADWVDTN